MSTPRFCYYVSIHDYDEGKGYIPAMVVENEPGYSLFGGNGPFAQPWYWGETYDDALDICRQHNEELGLSREDVTVIVASSMRAQGFD